MDSTNIFFILINEISLAECNITNLHTLPTEGIRISKGVGFCKTKTNLKKLMEANWNFFRGWVGVLRKKKIPPVREV